MPKEENIIIQDSVLGIDIGGTAIKYGIVDRTGVLIKKPKYFTTPKPGDPESILSVCKSIKKELKWTGKVGCGFPGVIKKGIVHTAANLSEKWIGVDIVSTLKTIYFEQVLVINDADAAGIAEIFLGNGKNWIDNNYNTILVVTLGTGIGSALFVKGRLVPNTEFGHIIMNGVSAEKLAATVVKNEQNITWEIWGKRVDRYLQYLNRLISPDCIIIGGGISQNPELFFKYLNVDTIVLPAKTKENAGIIGSAINLYYKS